MEEVKEKTNQIKKDTQENMERVDELVEEKTDIISSISPLPVSYETLQLDMDKTKLSPIIQSLHNHKYKFRTILGMSEETGIEKTELTKIITNLKASNIVKQLKGKGGTEIYTITAKANL